MPGILLVEDNPDDVVLTLRAVRSRFPSHEVEVLRNGRHAVQYIRGEGPYADRQDASPPGLVILDVNLPEVDGLEVLAELRAHDATRIVPVIVMSARQDAQIVRDAYLRGANSYIVKSTDFDRFVDSTVRATEYWLTVNEPPPS